jgi:hypothetical protein
LPRFDYQYLDVNRANKTPASVTKKMGAARKLNA